MRASLYIKKIKTFIKKQPKRKGYLLYLLYYIFLVCIAGVYLGDFWDDIKGKRKTLSQ